jgi:cation:H+ antiporter
MLADLVPQSLFQAIAADWVLWLIACGAIAAMVFGADRAVTAAVRLASALGMSTVIVGATVVSLGTTSPEAFVSVTAAFRNNPGLALGNGVGSIICDTALIFGLSCVLRRLPLDRFILRRHGWLQLGAGALLTATVLLLALGGGGIAGVVIPRSVGLVYVALLIGYLYLSVRWARVHPQAIPLEARAKLPAVGRARAAARNLLVLALGLGLVVVGSNLLVGSATELCIRYRVPQDVLAVTMVAFGTSLPELVTAMASLAKGHAELLVGNIVGADILNVLFVIGASAAATPLEVPALFFYFHLPVMMVALGLLRVFIFTSGASFRRWQGAPLLAIYVAYVAVLFLTHRTWGG